MGSGAVYEWGTGSTVGSSSLTTTTGNTYSVNPSAATTYWVRLKGTTGACSTTVTGGVTTSIAVYSAISPGEIYTASTTTNVSTNPSVTITNTTAASSGSGSFTYQWRRTGTSSATLTGTNTTYTLSDDATGNYGTAGTYYFNRYAKDATCSNAAYLAATGTYTLYVKSAGPSGTVTNQLCTKCCYDGSSWVDCYVTTGYVSSSAQWTGNSKDTYFSGARSDKNGRANFKAITAQLSSYTAGSAFASCKALGDGWYLPAYEELYNMRNGSATSYGNGLAGANILSDNDHWSSTEYYDNEGRYSESRYQSTYSSRSVIVKESGAMANRYKGDFYYVRCAWQN
jgi:hypothetical protein